MMNLKLCSLIIDSTERESTKKIIAPIIFIIRHFLLLQVSKFLLKAVFFIYIKK